VLGVGVFLFDGLIETLMRLGILELVSLLGSLIFAIPVANFGVSRLMAGEPTTGLVLVGVAVAMVVLPHYFLDPRTIARKLLAGLLPSRFRSDESTTTDSDTISKPNE